MTKFSSFICVAVPSALTLASLVAMLVAGLASIIDEDLYLFRIDTENLAFTSDTKYLIAPQCRKSVGFPSYTCRRKDRRFGLGYSANITAVDLGLAGRYDVSLWGYCYTPKNGGSGCTKLAFNWAETNLNLTGDKLPALVTTTGTTVTVPHYIEYHIVGLARDIYRTAVALAISFIALSVELFCGILANRSRISPCAMFRIAGIAAAAVCIATMQATVTSSSVISFDKASKIVYGAVEGVYGVEADPGHQFLSVLWIGAASAVSAGWFWLFATCSCLPNRRSKSTTEIPPRRTGRP